MIIGTVTKSRWNKNRFLVIFEYGEKVVTAFKDKIREFSFLLHTRKPIYIPFMFCIDNVAKKNHVEV